MGATVPAQARALLARSAIYQRRNTATNVCLVVAPIFFCVLLAVLQLLANNLILTQRDNKCGCQCLECCIPRRVQRPWTAREQQLIDSGVQLTPRFDRIEDCSALDTGYCERVRNATCRSYNDSSCSLRFSSPWQAVWCPIPQPSSWPPVMPMGRRANRAGGTLRQWMPFTGANMTAAREVAAGMFNLPELPSVQGLIEMFQTTPLSVLNLPPSKLLGLLLPALSPGVLVRDGGEAVDGALLSRLGLRFGSSLRPNTDYYLENAFINSNSNQSQLHVLMPEGGCIAAGLGNVTTSVSMPLVEMLLRVYNATYPALLQPLLAALNVTADTLLSTVSASALSAVTASCTEAAPREAANTTHMDRRLYCGFGAARCDGTFFTREYGAAWDFERLEPTALHVTNVYNLSLPYEEGPNNYRHNELLNAATRGWTQAYWGALPITARLRNRLLGLMSFPKLPTELKLDFSVLLGPLFYTWVVQMLMPSLLQQLVYEKEKRLRSMMKMHGLSDVAYWTVTYLWYLMLYVLYMVFFVVFGSAIGLKIFRTNSYGVQAVLYFIFGNNMIAFMYVLSSLFRSSRTATVSMFLYVFATGLMGELLLRDLMHTNPPFMVAVELLPGFALYRGLYELSEYSIRSLLGNTPGMTWASLSDPGNGMVTAWVIMLVEWPVFVLLGWYLEQVVSSGTGMRRHPLFFVRWMWHQPDDELAALHAYGHTGIKAAAADAAAPKPADSSSPTAASAAAADRPPVPQIANAPADSAYVPQHVSAVDSAYTPGFQVPDPVANGKRAVAEGTETTAVPTAAAELSDLAGGSTAAPGSGRLMVVAEAASPPRSRTASGGGGGGGGGGSARLHVGDAVSVGSGPASAASNHTVVLVGPSVGPDGGGSGSDGGSRPASSAAASPVPAVASGAASSAVTFGASRPSSGAAASSSQEADARIIVCPPDSARLGSGSGSGSGHLGKGSSFVTGAKAALAGLVRTSPKAAISPEEAAGSYTPDGVAVAGLQETGAEGVGGGGVKGMPDEIPWDVAAECVRVDEMDDERLRTTPIVIKGLTKVFPTDRGRSKRLAGTGGAGGGGGLGAMFSCCGARGGGGPRGHAAVRGLTLAIEKGECFGLLGPNGAGKTTTIHMLTGFLEPSAGDALVGGASVRSRMPHIYKTMGVCPQENLLWEQLTGEEHLLFYGRLKGLKGQELKDAVSSALRAVGLESRTTASASTTSTTTATPSAGGGTATANGTGTGTAAATPARGTAGTLASSSGAGRRRVGAYSGGMKRRLSVAIAFMGDPSVVYLDEPSTGLDPASRRALWDVVRAHKPGRALVLTTHSMEEAETLCDRLGIFVDGRLVCLGAPREITARHAGYLVFTLTVAPSPGGQAEAEAAEFVAALCPGAQRTYHLGGTSKYELPTSGVSLSGVFDAMSAAKEAGRMQVLDWGVASATLEEVFIKFARQIGAEVGDF